MTAGRRRSAEVGDLAGDLVGRPRARLYAHRGLSSLAPENTLAAVRAAAEHGLSWIEVDLDVLADGTVVVLHDSTLDRTTNRSGRYDALTAADLEGIDAGAWFAPRFAGEPLPTLPALLETVRAAGLNVNLELKSNEAGGARSLLLIEQVAARLGALEPGIEVLVSSFNHLLLHLFKQRAPQVPVACLYQTATLHEDWRSTMELTGAEHIHLEDAGLRREAVAAAREAGYGVSVWTVNSRVRANELLNWGVTGIFSDLAHEMLDLVRIDCESRHRM